MDTGTLIASIVGIIGVLLGGVGLYKQIRATTAADRDRAADLVTKQIADARQEERDTCKDRLDAKDERIAELVADRNAERERANDLQALINKRQLGSGR